MKIKFTRNNVVPALIVLAILICMAGFVRFVLEELNYIQ